MNVSIIIPAHNAAETIAETLESVLTQTHRDWEAIVVDDGSNDATADIARSFAERDARIRVVSQPHQGVSTARNVGIKLARYDWLLFLDADDWLLPLHLERLTDALVSNRDLDAVYCGWVRVAPDGTPLGEQYGLQSSDPFVFFSRNSDFAIHTCIVRRSLVEAVGGFDVSFKTCEDWDLWQRIARTGARFKGVHELLALYRVKENSASADGFQMFTDGLRVLKQGHAPDARVRDPDPAHANGLPSEQLPSQEFYFLSWCAGLLLGCDKDARLLLPAVKDDKYPQLDPNEIAKNIFWAVPKSTGQTPAAWIQLWPSKERRINEFLLALEEQAQAFRLARRARNALECLILDHSESLRPLIVGATYAVRVEITEPIPDILPPRSVERLHCVIELEGSRIGTLELPICDGIVPSYVLADAIAVEFAWPILGRFFERTVYSNLRIEQGSKGLSLWRGGLCLAEALPEEGPTFWQKVHDLVGWTVFLQEIWGHPEWPNAHFYDSKVAEEQVTRCCLKDKWLTVEVSEALPDVEVSNEELNVVLTVGGVPLGIVLVPVKRNIVYAGELRAALTGESGFELCRAVVREGLLGRPIADQPVSLRGRLATAAAQHDGGSSNLIEMSANVMALAPGSARALSRVISPDEHGVVLGRRPYGAIGTSVSRRAVLPAAAIRELIEGALVAGQAVFRVPESGGGVSRVIYAPDLIWRSFQSKKASAKGNTIGSGVNGASNSVFHTRSYFETLFTMQYDSSKYTSPYEQTKYEQILSLLPSNKFRRALELACAEGHFTVRLAPHVNNLIAADILQAALDRAAKRCADMKNIRFVLLDITRNPLPGHFDLIVCSEVLYYVGSREELQAVAWKITDALEAGGYLLIAHANLVVDDPDKTGFDWDLPFGAKVIGETFTGIPSLRLVKELRTPLYRIQLFQRKPRLRLPFCRSTPALIELMRQPTPLPPRLAEQVLWHGGSPRRNEATKLVVGKQLPILLYHRVAPAGSPAMSRYRVTPEAFEEHLRYLRDAGYYSVGLEDWRTAMEAEKPLPGRAVLLTFDDGYLDFLVYAWPLLEHYGFSATVFLVADAVGRSNDWDRVYGEEIPLLGWEEIHQLRDKGIEFGSHSVSHLPLTALSLEEVVREGARSKTILERQLGVPIHSFAYPYGDVDEVVQHLIGACGYIFGLSCRQEMSRFGDSLLALPRIEVTGSDSLEDFISKLCPNQ